MAKTILELFNLTPVKPRNYSKVIPVENPDTSLVYGVELEIENCVAYNEWGTVGITVENDGSLRNNGKEFITDPMTYSNMLLCLNRFFNKAKLTNENYSDRTSIHVHCNVQDLTMEQVGTILLLYTAFESLLYAFAGGERDKNIFCVPWNETNISYNYITRFAQGDYTAPRQWQKYTGLNVRPIETQGTIEFRHMPGTYDVAKIGQWLRIIGHLFAWARKNSFTDTREIIVNLNTTSEYFAFLEGVFRADVQYLLCPGFEQHLEAGVLGVKYATITIGQKATVKPMENVPVMVDIRRNNEANRMQRIPDFLGNNHYIAQPVNNNVEF